MSRKAAAHARRKPLEWGVCAETSPFLGGVHRGWLAETKIQLHVAPRRGNGGFCLTGKAEKAGKNFSHKLRNEKYLRLFLIYQVSFQTDLRRYF